MSWEIMLKDLRSRATSPEAMATRMGSGQYQPRDKPMFEQADCKVEVCAATQCFHNRNNKCTLPTITITADGNCGKYKKTPYGRSK